MDFSEVTFYKIHILVVECRLSDPVFFYIGNIDVEGGTYPSRPPPPLEGPQDPPRSAGPAVQVWPTWWLRLVWQ